MYHFLSGKNHSGSITNVTVAGCRVASRWCGSKSGILCGSGSLTSVSDPWHFGTDPGPWIGTFGQRIRILLFSKFSCSFHHFSKTKIINKSQNSRNQFFLYLVLLVDGKIRIRTNKLRIRFGSRRPKTYGSGFWSGTLSVTRSKIPNVISVAGRRESDRWTTSGSHSRGGSSTPASSGKPSPPTTSNTTRCSPSIPSYSQLSKLQGFLISTDIL